MQTSNICYNCFRYVPEGSKICPYCGYDPSPDRDKYRIALPPGTGLVGRYIVGRTLGQGGYGVTYVALDGQTRSRVAIKEYLPTDFVSRSADGITLTLNSTEQQEDYQTGKQLFLEEARTLAQFVGNEHVVSIHGYFEANDTAYFAMEYLEGVNLKQYMKDRGAPLPVHEANRLLLPIMETLQWVHSKGVVHRDIAPDNIMIRKDGNAKLIDFGAARYSTGEKSRSLDVILKHGFAPFEQYSRKGRQGPFTDVYAMAATYYYAITGKVPPDAVDRAVEDTLQLPGALGVQIRKNTEKVLEKALAVNAKDRWQSMVEFYSALLRTMPEPFSPSADYEETRQEPAPGSRDAKTVTVDAPQAVPPENTSGPERTQTKGKGRPKWPGAAIAVIVLLILAGIGLGRSGLLNRTAETSTPEETSEISETIEDAQQTETAAQEEHAVGGLTGDGPAYETEPAGTDTEDIPPTEDIVPEEETEAETHDAEPTPPADEDENTDQEQAELQEPAEEQADEDQKTEEVQPEEETSVESLPELGEIGSLVAFGHYEQDNDPENGSEPIEWIILDKQDGKALLIAREALDSQPYHHAAVAVTWETCALRAWLNSDFLNMAFGDEEKNAILMTDVDNGVAQGNPKYRTAGGNNTSDRVFLLSWLEAEDYFKSGEARACGATAYAIGQGVLTSDDGNCVWWLRSPGYYPSFASYVGYTGADGDSGNVSLYAGVAVRPAIWIDIEAAAPYWDIP